jgi:nucleoside-diphosphate-sugar epimerase
MLILIGGDSEIGAATARTMGERNIAGVTTTRRRDLAGAERPFLDLKAPLGDWRPPEGIRSACICVAVARLAGCAADPAGSAYINVTQTLTLIDHLLARDIHVLFLSTNQVFDGNQADVPADAPHSPISEYGRQKAQVEAALIGHRARGAPVAILRLAKVVSPHMMLIRDWIGALRQGKPIRAFHDMTMAPVPAALASDVILALMQNRAEGIFQLTGPRDVSYADTGRYLAARLGAPPLLVGETSALDNGQPVGSTPRHTTLDPSAIHEYLALKCPDAWPVIDTVLGSCPE